MSGTETFEQDPFRFSFTGDWLRTNQRAYEGEYSYGSRIISHNQQSNAYLTIVTDYIEFYWFVSSENNYDWFEFYIDGVREFRASGTSNYWTKFSKQLPSGEHTFRWRYMKDGSVTHGDDRAYIDNLVLSIVSNRYFIEDEGIMKAWNNNSKMYEAIQIIDGQTQQPVNVTPNKLTDQIFMAYGMEEIQPSKQGLFDLQSKIHYFTNQDEIVNQPQNYCLKLTETVTSLPKVVVEKTARKLGNLIDTIIIDDFVTGSGDLQYALSKDSVTWFTFNVNTMEWQQVNIANDLDFTTKGMRKIDFQIIQKQHYEGLFQAQDDLYLAFRFYKEGLTDDCQFKGVKINYTSPLDITM
ncbi:hypothetical protein [Alkalihalobacterium bogoriense]|uniref:hypothetical protein n=1 Tax=Alkalihalobacterium bogoriense TaxID=246272 RepID=UPI00047C65E9|nr:hypothetical protein [Alkalihalobacterium bogoriense]